MSGTLHVPSIKKGTYRHYKDKLYEVVGVALHSETQEPLVVYKPLYESDSEYWVRPYDMFVEQITIEGRKIRRFEKIED
jgi:hypothetical protein